MQTCCDALAAFYGQINGLSHHMIGQWEHGEATIVEADVTYTRTDEREVTVPVVTIYRTNAKNLIADYRVYIDLAPA